MRGELIVPSTVFITVRIFLKDRQEQRATPQLVILFLMLGLVLFAMFQAQNPDNWQWLLGTKRSATPSDATPSSKAPPEKSFSQPDANGLVLSHVDAMPTRFWERCLKAMTPAQQLDWLQLVHAAAAQRNLPMNVAARCEDLLAHVDRQCRDDEMEPGEWQEMLDEVPVASGSLALDRPGDGQQLWREQWWRAMDAVIRQQANDEHQTEWVERLPAFFGRVAQRLIEDGRPVQRAAETYAWFDAWHRLTQRALPGDSPPVTITSLLAQPRAYRGETVVVTGTVAEIHRQAATGNFLGIENYFVLWIKPDHVSAMPFCVYVRSLSAEWRDLLGQGKEQREVVRALNIPIRVEAQFYKVRLFYSQGEPNTLAGDKRIANAPVLFAPDLGGTPVAQPQASSGKSKIGWDMWMLMALFAVYLTWRLRGVRRRFRPVQRRERPGVSQNLNRLAEGGQVETVEEKLARLSEMMDSHDKEAP